jgi:Tat protein secretion system quality control protein TatD with DNase activity
MYSAQYGGRSGRAKGKQSKSKKKNKCGICGTKGHDDDDCPNKATTAAAAKNSGGAGSGISHKTSRKAAKKTSSSDLTDYSSEDANGPTTTLTLPLGFCTSETVTTVMADPFFFFDAGCDIGGTLDALALQTSTGSKKTKVNTPVATYQAAIAASASNYGGALCRQYLRPGRPWNKDASRNIEIKQADPTTFFVIGLGPRFFLELEEDGSDSEQEDVEDDSEGIDALIEAIETDDRVVGLFAKLDYSPDVLELPGHHKDTQLRRFRATCTAALHANVPIQCRVAPGPTENDDDKTDPYVMVVKDLAKLLLDSSTDGDKSNPSQQQQQHQLRIHLASWNGKSQHMTSLLKAFPETLYVGMNASVGFTKSALAHECAFDVPMNRLLLETDAPYAIPTPVATAMGRAAFCHSGLVPFCAAAVAELKKMTEDDGVVQVARVAAANTVRLYGRGVAVRAQEAAEQAATMLAEADSKREEEAAAQALLESEKPEQLPTTAETGDEDEPAVLIETKKEKKKKKKGGQASGQQQQGAGGGDNSAEAEFDEEFLSTLRIK